MVGAVIIVPGPSALATARGIRDLLGDAELHGPHGRVDGLDVTFLDMKAHIVSLFTAGRPVIGVCATGILVRILAGSLREKDREPPVLAVAVDGSCVVPLLGGHHGANDLARRVAMFLGGFAAITTASDVCFSVALDEPPKGWTLANPQSVKSVTTRLLSGEKARLVGAAPWLTDSDLPFDEAGAITLAATHSRDAGDEARLVYHPSVLALGVGCARGTDPEELIRLVMRTLDEHGLARCSVALVASIDLKADEPAIHALADHLHRPARFLTAERLRDEEARLTLPSDIVRREVGVAGVAEAAALAAAGAGGELVVAKRKSARATCALALSPVLIDPERVGYRRGRLAIVGVGPGDAGWLTPQARAALREADDWVGYDLYLDLIASLRHGQVAHPFPLGAESERARHALELAATGRNVALVSSGDPGIYAMATLVYELLDAEVVSAAARRAEIVVLPGISAFQAAAARFGAPVGHDFCLISLSDLLTPWSLIEERVTAAARSDFVMVFYNPRSRRRRWQIEKAFVILARFRPADTPVMIASNLGRPEENIKVTTLAAFDPDEVDMLTIVIVGSSRTKLFTGGDGRMKVYTPRGYAVDRECGS